MNRTTTTTVLISSFSWLGSKKSSYVYVSKSKMWVLIFLHRGSTFTIILSKLTWSPGLSPGPFSHPAWALNTWPPSFQKSRLLEPTYSSYFCLWLFLVNCLLPIGLPQRQPEWKSSFIHSFHKHEWCPIYTPSTKGHKVHKNVRPKSTHLRSLFTWAPWIFFYFRVLDTH